MSLTIKVSEPLLNSFAEQYPVERLGIIAFHLEADNAALQALAQAKGYRFTLVSIQKTPGLGIDLTNTMGMKIVGDVAVINRKGRIADIIETKSLTQSEFDEKVRAAVKKIAGS